MTIIVSNEIKDRILATAIWDEANTNRLSEQDPKEQETAVHRAANIRKWLQTLGYDIIPITSGD